MMLVRMKQYFNKFYFNLIIILHLKALNKKLNLGMILQSCLLAIYKNLLECCSLIDLILYINWYVMKSLRINCDFFGNKKTNNKFASILLLIVQSFHFFIYKILSSSFLKIGMSFSRSFMNLKSFKNDTLYIKSYKIWMNLVC